ncbi:MAG: methylmalonyl Co-A mutase-associated GTPase MeaB [Deltaproteobacteria bacterium]|nr:methylmalonyl Co-A mutase-associated GTPase MeaB [Deltaproteobacteria bacterium]
MHPLSEKILNGDPRSLARLLRAIDDRQGSYLVALAELYPHTGRAKILGITGNPGAGKSTLTDRLISHYRKLSNKVGVIAVDPTSPFTGGAILGDRIRMQQHALDEGVFIRSLATRGNLGGISRSTADSVHALDAWGADVILVETVGVGQDELDIARLAQSTIVVVPPGLGDEVQAIKAGILEIADIFVVNKADREGADATVRDLESMIAMGHELHHSGVRKGAHHGPQRVDLEALQALAGDEWLPPIVKAVASRGQGIGELCEAVERHRTFLFNSPVGEQRRRERHASELSKIFATSLIERAMQSIAGQFDDASREVFLRRQDPYSAARELIAAFLSHESSQLIPIP